MAMSYREKKMEKNDERTQIRSRLFLPLSEVFIQQQQ